MRQRTLLSAAALLVVAACADQPTGLEPTPAPHPSFDRSEVVQVAPTGTGATTIKLVDGNIPGNGGAVCSSLEVGRGPTGWKVDGASGTTRDGLMFTVIDGKYLQFSRVSGTNVVTAVVVKGGEDAYVYYYGAGATSGAGLRAPLNGGGNVPVISHYTFCYQPGPSITKVLTNVKTTDGNAMPVDPTWSAGGPVIIPKGETRWLYYTINYSIPGGGSGTVTESPASVCATLGAGFGCSFDTGAFQPAATITGSGANTLYTWNVSGTGSIVVILDITNNGACGVRDDVDNTATLTATGGASASATAKVWILGVCVRKVLTDVKSSAAGMPTDPAWKANPGTVAIPSGDTRWLYYEIRYDLPTGLQASVAELANAVCASLGPNIGCSFDTAHFTSGYTFSGGSYTWSPVMGSGKVIVVIDITNNGGCSQGFTNTAALRTTGGAHIANASHTVQLQLQGCAR